MATVELIVCDKPHMSGKQSPAKYVVNTPDHSTDAFVVCGMHLSPTIDEMAKSNADSIVTVQVI